MSDRFCDKVVSFYKLLGKCQDKSAFDEQFLADHDLQSLLGLSFDDWMTIYKDRFIHTREIKEFNWIEINAESKIEWIEDCNHVNRPWYKLALEIARITNKEVVEIIFVNVEISKEDCKYLKTAKNFAYLVFNNSFQRLSFLQRILHPSRYEENKDDFGSYKEDEGIPVPISPFELYQMKRKLTTTNLTSLQEMKMSTWNEFVDYYAKHWSDRNLWEKGDLMINDLLYPLNQIVLTYFSELKEHFPHRSTVIAIDNFYKEHLQDLDIPVVNYFYGRMIDSQTPLYEIFISLRENNIISSSLPQIIQLALWITQRDPLIVLDESEVMKEYERLEIGPYVTKSKLIAELEILLTSYSEELEEEEKVNAIRRSFIEPLITELTASSLSSSSCVPQGQVLLTSMKEEEQIQLFQKLQQIYVLHEQYNQTRTFMKVTNKGFASFPRHYIYYQKGINAQFIKIAQLLQSCNFWQPHGIEDYYQILMPTLRRGIDTVTLEPLSSLPFSNYIIPEEINEDNNNYYHYLISLKNSKQYCDQTNQQCFYNINNEKGIIPFTPNEYTAMLFFAPSSYAKYPRIPTYTSYTLSASTIKELILLINKSLYSEALINNEGYTLQEGFTTNSYSNNNNEQDKIIEYILNKDNNNNNSSEVKSITYRIRDHWNRNIIYTDNILFPNKTELSKFREKRLEYIMKIAIHRGHARANITRSKYYLQYTAFTHFQSYINTLDPTERNNLLNTTMRYGDKIRQFKEIWLDGYPSCMSAASLWFLQLVIDYFPNIRFSYHIEKNEKYVDTLARARRDSRRLYMNYILNDLTNTLPELIDMLNALSSSSHDYQIPSLSSVISWGMGLLGFNSEDNPNPNDNVEELLSIPDTPTNQQK